MKDTRILISLAAALICGTALMGQSKPVSSAQSKLVTKQADTPPLVFVTEYVHQLVTNEDRRAEAEKDFNLAKQEAPSSVFLEAIHGSTRIQLELRDQIATLNRMHLSGQFDFLIPGIVAFYEQKIKLHQQMIDICSAFVGGPKPGVDYDQLAIEMPKIRAEMEQTDHYLMDVIPAVFGTLVDLKADSKGHCSHLVITKAEKEKLVEDLTTGFGDKLDQKSPNFIVGSAQILNSGLTKKNFLSADDPWE
jgi:hypothetical protein